MVFSRKETLLEMFFLLKFLPERQSGGVSLLERVLSISIPFVPLNVVHPRRVYTKISRATTYAIM